MPSANDNFQLRDGTANLFKVRSKDTSAAADGSLQTMRHLAVSYPVDYGVGGCFRITSKSGTMAAGLAASAPIYSFRWPSSTMLAIVRRIRLTAWSLGTGFAAGVAIFDLLAARSWTVADTGGVVDTITTNNGKLRSAMASTALSEIRHSSTATLTAGTRTLDAQAIDFFLANVTTATNTGFVQPAMKLFEASQFDHPLVLAQNEGFVIQATVPATGTWQFGITPEWDEVPLANY